MQMCPECSSEYVSIEYSPEMVTIECKRCNGVFQSDEYCAECRSVVEKFAPENCYECIFGGAKNNFILSIKDDSHEVREAAMDAVRHSWSQDLIEINRTHV